MARQITKEIPLYTTESQPSLVPSLLAGAFVGLFGWLLSLALNSWVLVPVFCRSADTTSACSNAPLTAWIIAYILVSIVGLFMLIRANVFRPLLVVAAALLTLWAVGLWFVSSAWWVGLIWSGGLFAVAYALYAWLASAKRFAYALIAIVVLVILFRLLMAL